MLFSGGTCPNPDDPLFIHLRIKTDKKNIYDKLTKYVREAFPGKLLMLHMVMKVGLMHQAVVKILLINLCLISAVKSLLFVIN